MMLTVRREGMTLDLLLWEEMRRNDEALIVATLAANPGLAAKGHVLPVGTVVQVPDEAPPRAQTTIRLWD